MNFYKVRLKNICYITIVIHFATMVAIVLLLIPIFSFYFKEVNLISPVSDPHQTIVAVGLRKENLMFLTRSNNKKYFTYTYPTKAINAKQMRISSKNVSIKNVSSALDQFGKNRIFTGALVRSKEHHDVLFAARSDWRNTTDTGFFDFDSQNNIFFESSIPWKKSMYISSSEVETMYSFQLEPLITMQKLTFKTQHINGFKYMDITDSNVLRPVSNKLNFCLHISKHNDHQIYMESTKNSCYQNTNVNKKFFNVNAGIFLKEISYLFGPENVYSFDKLPQNLTKKKVKITWCSLKEFFQ